MSEISTETSTRNLPSARVSMTDSPSLQITTHKLNGSNYLQWSQSVKMFITGRGKLGYLTGALTAPTDGDQAAEFLWETENAMIMAWLINSMEPEIGQVHLFLHTAKAIWDTVAATYSNRGNSAQVFALKTSLKDIRQGNQDVTRFFNQLKNIWQEIDQYSVLDWENKNDSIRYQRLVEKDRVYDFLAGLRPEYDEARERILGREPLQPLMDVFAYIRREESRKEAMNGSRLTASVDNSALVADPVKTAAAADHNNRSNSRRADPKANLWCDHCQKPRHTKDTCWQLHGKPASMPQRNPNQRRSSRNFTPSRAHIADTKPSGQPFTKEQSDWLHQLLQTAKTESSGDVDANCTVAQQGIALNTLSHSKIPWIIDSGASDHMTGEYRLFDTYKPSSGSHKVRIADGSLSPIAGKGSISLSNHLSLDSVLHVPNLTCNLFSVSKFTQTNKCVAKFFPFHCVSGYGFGEEDWQC